MIENTDIKYALGETCLLIDPFDNYRVFTLFTNNPENPDERFDVTGQKVYLVFKHNNKEIRIPEIESYNPELDLNRANGQVLFKINKKQATDIMSLNSRTFYITRVYETYNSTSDAPVTSDEEVIYSGYWGDRNRIKESNLTSYIEGLEEELKKKNEIIQGMTNTISDLVKENSELYQQRDDDQEKYDELQKQYDEFRAMVEEAYPGFNDIYFQENKGTLIDSKTFVVDYQNADEGMQGYFDSLASKGGVN